MSYLRSRLSQYLEYGFVVLLLVTGMAKLVSSTGHDRVLLQPDPIFQISNKALFVTAGAGELILSLTLLRSLRRNKPVTYQLAAVSFGFLAYRFCAYAMGFHGYCKCLGTLTHQIGVGDRMASSILWVMAVLMFVYAHASIFCEQWPILHRAR